MTDSLVKCRHCDGACWYTIPTGPNGEAPEQCQCEYCGGTGSMTKKDASTFDQENTHEHRHDSDQASRSGLHFTHGNF